MGITSMRQELGRQCTFHGAAGTLFGIILANFFLTILTAGIYFFWAQTRVRQYVISHLEFEGDRFDYHGTGTELFLGFLKLLVLVIPCAAIIYVLPVEELRITGVYLAIALLAPLVIHSALRYRMSRLSWRNVRFSFRGRLGECYQIIIVGIVLSFLTFGLYVPYFRTQWRRHWISHTYFGNTPFQYFGHGKDLFAIYMRYWLRTVVFLGLVVAAVAAMGFLLGGGLQHLHRLPNVMKNPDTAASPTTITRLIVMQSVIVLMYLAIGLNWLWYRAAEHRFHWGHTGFAKVRCYSNMAGGAMLVLYIVHALAYLFTIGLGFAWIRLDCLRFNVSRVFITGMIDFEQIVQDMNAAQGEQ